MDWEKLFKDPREVGVRAHLVDLVESLYELNSVMMRVDGKESKAFGVEQGVH